VDIKAMDSCDLEVQLLISMPCTSIISYKMKDFVKKVSSTCKWPYMIFTKIMAVMTCLNMTLMEDRKLLCYFAWANIITVTVLRACYNDYSLFYR